MNTKATFVKPFASVFAIIWISLQTGLAQDRGALQRIWDKSLPYITNYTTDHYKADVQNWWIEQDHQGILYFANNSGILEFDGAAWKLIKTPQQTAVRSLCKDSKGRIYVGAVNEIGYLAPDAGRGTKFHALPQPAGVAFPSFGDVWFTYCINDAIYFVCNNHILRWFNNQWKIWDGDFGFAWNVNETLYVSARGQGLMKLEGDTLTLVKGGATFIGKSLMALLPYQQHLLSIGGDKEVNVFDGSGTRPIKKNGAVVKTRDAVYNSVQLKNGDYALGTTGSGLYMMDGDGNMKLNISRQTGLTSDAVYFVFQDAEGDVWCATDNGLSRIELESPLRIVNEKHGLDENTFDLEYFNNSIFIGTSKGLFQLGENPSDAASLQLRLKKIRGIDNLTQDCHIAQDHLVVANYDGIFTINKRNEVACIYPGHTTWVESPTLPDQRHLLFETMDSGIRELIYERGQWKLGAHKVTLDGRAYSMVRSPEGNILINTTRNGIFEIQWKQKAGHHTLADSYSIVHLDTTRGLSSMTVRALARVGNTLYASTDKGVHRYDDVKHTFARVPGIMRYLRPYDGAWINEIAAAKGDHFWICVYHDYASRLFKYTGSVEEFPASGRFSNELVTKMYEINQGIVLFGTNKSLILYNENKKSDLASTFRTMIRRVALNRDSAIYAGGSGQPGKAEIPFDHNSIHFQFSLPSYDLSSQNQFQYMLDGFDNGWSSWSTRPNVTFSNLSEGHYAFRVRGRNVYGQESGEGQYTFSILPPWYRTWWAYSLYVMALVGTVVMIVQWRSRELKREKVALERVISERTEKIRQQAEQLKEIDHLKSSFFANISHEFRTPLTLILAPLENALNKSSSREDRDTFVLMKRNATRLLELVNQLLDLSKLEAGKMVLHIREGDLNQFLSVMAASFDSYASGKGIAFTRAIAVTNICWYDADKLEKIITNLLSNAFKYTPQGGQVSMTVKTEGIHMLIRVSDTGPGIPEAEQSNLFSPFYQTRQSAGQYVGTGLGLSLVKELVKLHNGSVTFTSTPGQGTTFSVTIPIAREAFSAEQIIEDGIAYSSRERISDAAQPEDFEIELEVLPESGGAILIAEDNPDMRWFIATTLQKNGYTVTAATNGEEALQQAFSAIPSLVLTDLMMPGMDGIELTDKLKNDERTSHIPVILLTAKDEQHSRMDGLQSGADDYLTKPFSPEELLVRIGNLIEQRQKLAAKFRERVIIPPAAGAELSLDEKFLHRVYTIIEGNLSDYTFSVEKLAEDAHMSRAQLLRKLKALTGLSPNDFIKDLRLKRAAEMIRQKVSTISQIGYAVGFNDQSYFSKCFKKQFGVSPSDYENSNR